MIRDKKVIAWAQAHLEPGMIVRVTGTSKGTSFRKIESVGADRFTGIRMSPNAAGAWCEEGRGSDHLFQKITGLVVATKPGPEENGAPSLFLETAPIMGIVARAGIR